MKTTLTTREKIYLLRKKLSQENFEEMNTIELEVHLEENLRGLNDN